MILSISGQSALPASIVNQYGYKERTSMKNALQCKIVLWKDFYHLARKVSRKIRDSGYSIDIIVAIGRGGYVPGRILSDLLGIKNLTSFKIEHYRDTREFQSAVVKYPLATDVSEKNVLLVDDVNDSGETFEAAIEHLHDHEPAREIRTAVIHHKIVSRITPDYYAEKITEWHWMLYPWAVNEDISSMIQAMRPRPKSLGQIRRRLKTDHGIEVSSQQIKDALLLVQDE